MDQHRQKTCAEEALFHQITLDQASLTFHMLWKTSVIFGLCAGKIKYVEYRKNKYALYVYNPQLYVCISLYLKRNKNVY